MKVTSNDSTGTAKLEIAGKDGEFKALIDAIKTEGLAKGENVSVEFKDGKLSINGVEQGDDVVKKLEMYLGDKKGFNITINNETKKQ